MRRLLRLAAGLLVALRLGGEAGAAEPLVLRVLAYNIHHGEGLDGRLDLERLAEVIRGAEPDVVLLQEVDQGIARSGGGDQPAELARLTEMQVAFGPNLEFGGGLYGNALLSRFPIAGSENHRLPQPNDSEPRGLLEVELETPDGRPPLIVFCTHFDHRHAEERRLSAEFVARRATELGARPLLLGGDLNATPDEPPLQILTKTWTVAGDLDQPTSPADSPRRKIDYVLTTGPGWRVLESVVLDESVASDHRPVLAVLELENK